MDDFSISESTINSLPKEILAKIFNYLPSRIEHRDIAKVSGSWERIIEDYLELAVVVGTVGNGYFVIYPNVPLDRQMVVSAYTWTTISSKSSATQEKLILPVNRYPQLKNPYTLKKLVLIGNMNRRCLLQVTDSLQNLIGLCVHISVFEKGEIFSNDKLDLPNLKYLILDDSGCVLRGEDADIKGTYDSTASLLRISYFPSLERLGIEFPLFKPREACLTNAIVGFIEKHASTLTALTVHQKYEVGTSEEDCEEESDKENEEESGEDCDGESKHDITIKMLSRNAMKLKGTKLEEIYISLFDVQESSPLWKNFLSHQTILKKLFYINYEIPFPESLIKKNISTLNVVVVNIKTSVNFSSFMGDRCQIRTIVLIGSHRNSSEPQIDIPDARNLCLLPKSVRSLKLCGISALSKDLEVVALEKPNLKELVLEHVGTRYQLGMTLETYGNLLEKKEIRRFRIKNSFNTASFKDISRIPKNVEGLSTVFMNSKVELLVEGSLDETTQRYIMDGNRNVNIDLEGEGDDVFNLLSGIVDAKNQFQYDEYSDSESSGRSGTESDASDRESESDSQHNTDTSDTSSEYEGNGSEGDRAKSGSDSDVEDCDEAEGNSASCGDTFEFHANRNDYDHDSEED